MSYFSSVLQACPNLQSALDQEWLNMPVVDRAPLMEFLTSPTNRRNVSQLITPGRGKIRTIELLYDQRLLESTVQANQPNPNCEPGPFYGNEVATYTLDPNENLQSPGGFTIDVAELACEDNASVLARQIMKHIDVLDRRVATEYTAQAVTLAATGAWGQNVVTPVVSDILQLDTFDTNRKPLPDTWIDLRNALDDSGYGDSVALFGGATMRKYMQFLQAGCCADYGLDLGEIMSQYGYGYGYDKRVKNTHPDGEDGFMVVQPGALQVLNFSRAEGRAAFGEILNQGSNYAYTTIRSPRFGLAYDVVIKDDCGVVTMNITCTGKVIALPNNMFAVGDEYEGVIYTALGEALTCVDTACEQG